MSVVRPELRCSGSGRMMPADSSTRHVCEQCGRTIRVTINPVNGATRMVAYHKPTLSKREIAAKSGRGPGRPPKAAERVMQEYVCFACRGHRFIVLPVPRGQIPLPKACPTCKGSGTVQVNCKRIEKIDHHRVPQEL